MINNTFCVQFRPKISTDTYFILVQNSSGCSATVGYNDGYSGDRYLNLMHTPTSSCMHIGTIQHELMHILGFFHEHSRPDRDQFVTIEYSNIASDKKFAFDKYSEEKIDRLGTEYDYDSIMHYNAYAFSINGHPTIIPKKSGAVIGRRTLSLTDILEIQRYYRCVAYSTANQFFVSKSAVFLFILILIFVNML
ncbi:unnamed protein product [Adineta steineri]|nr:unnamed protein product [Adineta steineri]